MQRPTWACETLWLKFLTKMYYMLSLTQHSPGPKCVLQPEALTTFRHIDISTKLSRPKIYLKIALLQKKIDCPYIFIGHGTKTENMSWKTTEKVYFVKIDICRVALLALQKEQCR